MSTAPQICRAAPAIRYLYRVGDYVLYRDPNRYWAGLPGHTQPYRVDFVGTPAGGTPFYGLEPLTAGGQRMSTEASDYMRLLPAADAMADIDLAPLNDPDPAGMTPAAVAWSRQHTAQLPAGGSAVRPELPGPR